MTDRIERVLAELTAQKKDDEPTTSIRRSRTSATKPGVASPTDARSSPMYFGIELEDLTDDDFLRDLIEAVQDAYPEIADKL